MLAQAASSQFYSILISAAAILLVIGAIAVLANYLRKMAVEREQDRTGLGLSIDQIEQMHSQGQISDAEYKLLRRLALGKLMPEAAKAHPGEKEQPPTPAAASPSQPSEELSPALEALFAQADARAAGQERQDELAILRRKVIWATVVVLVVILVGAVTIFNFVWPKGQASPPDSVGPALPPGPTAMPGRYVGFPPTTATSHPSLYPAYPTTGPFPGPLPRPTSEPILEQPQTQPAAQQ